MSFCPGRWSLCLAGQGQEPLAEMWQKHPSGCVCGCVSYWHIQWVLSSFDFPLPFPQANQESVLSFAKHNGKLGCLKTTPFPSVGFGNDELIKETLGGGEEGACLLGKMAEIRKEREAWFVAPEQQGWRKKNHLQGTVRAWTLRLSVVTSWMEEQKGMFEHLPKLLGPFITLGNRVTFLMMTDDLRIRLNLI